MEVRRVVQSFFTRDAGGCDVRVSVIDQIPMDPASHVTSRDAQTESAKCGAASSADLDTVCGVFREGQLDAA